MIYIVDDDQSFLNSLQELVEIMGYKVLGLNSAESFLENSSIQRPACLLLDVYLPNLDGFALQKELKNKNRTIPIIFMTGHGDVPMSVRAMKNGAEDFLLKPFNTIDLRTAINNALESDKRNLKAEKIEKRILSQIGKLTPREVEVMREIITGKLNKQIAATLGTAEKTIRKHRGRVMRKMQVSSVADLVRTLEKVGISHPSLDHSYSS